MGRIGTATLSRRANGLTSSGSLMARKLAELAREERANERGASHVCILRQDDTNEPVRLVQECASSQRAASAYRQGRARSSRVDRPRSHGASQRLEPDEGKLSRPVLRGGSGSNAASLPDQILPPATSGSLKYSKEPVACAPFQAATPT